jgi:hypothetical protein
MRYVRATIRKPTHEDLLDRYTIHEIKSKVNPVRKLACG